MDAASTSNDTETVRMTSQLLLNLMRAQVPPEDKIYQENATTSYRTANLRRSIIRIQESVILSLLFPPIANIIVQIIRMNFTFLLVGPTSTVGNDYIALLKYINSGGLAADSGLNIITTDIPIPTFAPTPSPAPASTSMLT